IFPKYRMNLDEWPNLHPSPRPKGMDSALNAYMYGPARFQLPVVRLQQGLVDSGQGAGTSPPGGGGEEYSPVSDWGGSDRASGSGRPGPAPAQSNGSAQRPRPSQAEYDKEKMEKLLKLIQLHKRALGKEDSSGQERSEDWDPAGLKRRLEDDGSAGVSKYLNTGLLSNGDLSGCIEALMSVYMELMFLLFWLIQFSLSVPDSVGDEAASGADRPGQAAGRTLDSILDQEFQNLCTGIRELMDSQQILYVSQPPPPRHEGRANGLESTFSPYVSNYISPPTVQTYVNTLCEKMNRMIHSPGAPPNPAANAATPTVAAHPSPVPVTSPLPSAPASATAPHLPVVTSPATVTAPAPAASAPLHSKQPAGGSNVIGQIKPEVLSTLVEIMQMNTVRFYIQRGDQDENQLCTEIKRYLESLGNIECNPQTYLENNCQQKFMVIIQNEDIASHVHKIPALVSLKKLPTVYFAGVDSLDDVKNRTYNELFVSGGLVVSDELILNPDYITLEKLQAFLQLLEKQNMSWKWKVHCKTQKKLKELSRLNTEALELLNLLTVYQKKHLVEFLPYHECDAPSKQAPDLDCLVKLQAQHTQLRHIIFLTDKCFDVPKFSSNGVIIASITDIMTNFESLVSSAKAEVPAVPILSAPGTTMSTSAANHPSDFI
uniref:Transcription activation suppressor b n=1 Tax=Pygocentrus nattereri TaxID=42514 RepID=A0AAR2IN61_PYGNA